AAGPVIFVGNHQLYGFSDIPLVVEQIYRERGQWVRALAHPVAFSRGVAEEGEGGEGRGSRMGAVDFETFGAVPVSPRALFKLLQRGEPTLLYPGGVREAFKSTKKVREEERDGEGTGREGGGEWVGEGERDGETYKLFWPPAEESSDFARVAARFNATIVPVAAVGAEEGFEMLLDADEALSLPFFGDRLREGAKEAPVGRPGERFVTPISLPKLPGRCD
ncbi:MAG: hypothetical protein SGPRY_007023, partial [Prymnesium sp.]